MIKLGIYLNEFGLVLIWREDKYTEILELPKHSISVKVIQKRFYTRGTLSGYKDFTIS